MKRIFTLLILAAAVLPAFSQSFTQTFEGNNFRWNQATNGSLFFNQEISWPGLEVPIGESNYTIFASAFWVGGVNAEGDLKIDFKRFCLNENEYCEGNYGPLREGASPNESTYAGQFNRFWFVTAEDVILHTQYFDCLQSADCDIDETFPDGYEIPEAFLTWPAHGDTLQGYDFYLAPFFDSNFDNTYNAEDGDYPIFCGDFASYLITNDVGIQGDPVDPVDIGIEIHTQVYGYNAQSGALFNTLFVQQKVVNRGNQELSEAYVASWTDFDIGNFNDDYVGTDVARSMFYGFNGDGDDEGSASGPGYGTDVAATGVRFLSGVFADNDQIDNPSIQEGTERYGNQTSGWNDGIVDNERLGLYSAVYHQNANLPEATNDPIAPLHYYTYMRGLWKDETPITPNDFGYNPDLDLIATRYSFLGDTDPLLEGSDGLELEYPIPGGWTESNEGLEGADRRMLGSSGPFTFAPGDVQYLDYAYIFARESFDENETVIETLQRYADEIVGMECGQLPPITLSTKFEEASKLGIEIFPNPAQSLVNFRFFELYKNIEIEIRDLNGRLVSHNRYGMINQVAQEVNFAPGVYIVRIFADEKGGTSKLVISE